MLDAKKDRLGQDCEGLVPIGLGGAVDRTHRPDHTGVIVSDVESAVFAHRALDESFDVGLAGDVGSLVHAAPAGSCNFGDDQFATLRIKIGGHHCRAFLGETQRTRTPETAGRPGNYRDFAVKFAHGRMLLRGRRQPVVSNSRTLRSARRARKDLARWHGPVARARRFETTWLLPVKDSEADSSSRRRSS